VTPATRKRIQLVMAVALALATLRAAIIFYGATPRGTRPRRSRWSSPTRTTVVPRKLHAYDLKSARELVGRPVDTEGYRSAYFPCDRRASVRLPAASGCWVPSSVEVKDVVVASPWRPASRRS
jgi:hypothetical protein